MNKKLGLGLMVMMFLVWMTGCGFGSSNVDEIVKSGGWIYYTNVDENTIYKMKPDMSELTKVGQVDNDSDFIVRGDTIYFMEAFAPDFKCSLSRIGTDGTGYEVIADLGGDSMSIIDVSDGWIYYANWSSDGSAALSRIRDDGTKQSSIAVLTDPGALVLLSGDWLYYAQGNSMARMRTDGSQTTVLSDTLQPFEILDGWIYCGRESQDGVRQDIYRMRLNGTEEMKLADGEFVTLDGEWLYYFSQGWLCRAALDGSGAEQLNDAMGEALIEVIYGDGIFCIGKTYTAGLGPGYRVNLAGEDKTGF